LSKNCEIPFIFANLIQISILKPSELNRWHQPMNRVERLAAGIGMVAAESATAVPKTFPSCRRQFSAWI
jgi:hypothetical protein